MQDITSLTASTVPTRNGDPGDPVPASSLTEVEVTKAGRCPRRASKFSLHLSRGPCSKEPTDSHSEETLPRLGSASLTGVEPELCLLFAPL